MKCRDLDAIFEDYLVNIALTRDQANRIDEKLNDTASLFLSEYEDDFVLYAQGSYAMGTTVRPLTEHQSRNGIAGEYDIDIVLERHSWQDAKDTLQEVRNVLSEEYGNKVDEKLRETCERVDHHTNELTGVNFHVDYVPIKNLSSRFAARRSKNEWFISDTKQLVEWFQERATENLFLPSIILILKRMRDYAGHTDILSSISITALVAELYEDCGTYGDDLLEVLSRIIEKIDVPYMALSITLPVLEDDLADRISQEDHVKILDFFKQAYQKLSFGFENFDTKTIRDVLSDSFPASFENYPAVLEPLRNRGWAIELNGSLNITGIAEDAGHGHFLTKARKRFYGVGETLRFKAQERDRATYGIRWQVLNSAESIGNRRGQLFDAKAAGGKTNSNEFVNHETERYSGEHWIRYFIYNKETKKVEEIGSKFFVEVDKN